MKNKMMAVLAITILVAAGMCPVTGKPVPVVSIKVPTQDIKDFEANYGLNGGTVGWWNKFFTTENWEHTRLILYCTFLGMFTQSITTDISKNLINYVLMNPDPLKPEVTNVMNFFISLLLTAYVLAIVATALYLILFSISPKQRANAKYMLGRLVIGMLLVSVSPQILNIFFGVSQSMTRSILGQADAQVAISNYNDVLWNCYWMSVIVIWSPIVVDEVGREKLVLEILKTKRLAQMAKERDILTQGGAWQNAMETFLGISTAGDWQGDLTHRLESEVLGNQVTMDRINSNVELRLFETFGPPMDPESEAFFNQQFNTQAGTEVTKEAESIMKTPIRGSLEYLVEKIKLKPNVTFTFPYLMAEALLIFALYGFLALRFFMLMIWTILFPVTIFFTSFELTKGLGKNMIEQTIFWTILQVFFAISIAVIAAGFSIMPAGFDYFAIGPPAPFDLIKISMFSIGACVVLLLTPIILLTLSQRLMAQ